MTAALVLACLSGGEALAVSKTIYLRGTNTITEIGVGVPSARWRSEVHNIWRASGASEDHDTANIWLEFSTINGFYTPPAQYVWWHSDSAEFFYHQWTNSFSVNVDPANVVWTLSGPTNFTHFNYGTRTGSLVNVACPTGSYSIVYNRVQDHYAPTNSPQAIDILGDDIGVFGSTLLPYTNSITVLTEGIVTAHEVRWNFNQYPAEFNNSSAYQLQYTNTAAVNTTLVNPIPTSATPYVVYFPGIFGYTTPDPQQVSVTILGDLSPVVTGVYTRLTNGVIRVSPNRPNAEWEITGYPSDYPGPFSGMGSHTISNVPVGNYTIFFNPLAGYDSPSPNPVTSSVNDGVLTDFIGTYTFTGRRLTINIVLPNEAYNGTNLAGIGRGFVERSPEGAWDGGNSWYYPNNANVNLTAIPTNIVIDGISYRSFFFEWYGRRWTGSAWVADLGGYNNPSYQTNITVTMNADRLITVLFSREKYPWDNVGDLDGDGLPDEWERRWGLNPMNPDGPHGPDGNPSGGWIPSDSPEHRVSVEVDGNFTRYRQITEERPGYPLFGARLNSVQQLGVDHRRGYAGGVPFNNLLQCRGFDGFYRTNGGHWDATAPEGYVEFVAPDDDPRTDPFSYDTMDDGISDGWKYYFWYWRSAEAYARGLTNSANLDWVRISPTRFLDYDRDTDRDGLTDYDEYFIGTDPTHCDTDGDGIDDTWEYRFGLNPRNPNDSLFNPDSDFYAVREIGVLDMTNGVEDVGTDRLFAHEVVYIGALAVDDVEAAWIDVSGNTNFTLYRDIILIADDPLTNGMPGTVIPHDVYYRDQADSGDYRPGYPVWVDIDGDGVYTTGVDLPLINPDIKHELVYMAPPEEPGPGVSSFDPRTAWFGGRTTFEYSLTNYTRRVTTEPVFTEAYHNYQEYLGGSYIGRISWDATGRRIGAPNDLPIRDSDGRLSPELILEYLTSARPRTEFTIPVASFMGIRGDDTDGDGIPDGWELYVGLNPNDAGDAGENPDSDGLTNLEEWANTHHDLSRDLVADWPTKIWPTDPGAITAPPPNDPHPHDTDFDGLPDGRERDFGTSPVFVDTDGDGLPDGWEVYGGTDPIRQDANEDTDGDGLLNWQEYWTGTVPEWQYCNPNWGMRFLTRRIMRWDLTWGPSYAPMEFFLPPNFMSCPSFLYENNVITDLAVLREQFPAAASLDYNYHNTTFAGPEGPSRINQPGIAEDTDMDGMDDFWEVYHCLNPLAGNLSRIAGFPMGGLPIVGGTDAAPNLPGYQVGFPGAPFSSVMDLINVVMSEGGFMAVPFIVGPHNFGLIGNDPDGDGIPNFEEYTYYMNVPHLHTGPSPLWRTEPYTSGPYSFVARNYTHDNTPELLGWNVYGFEGILFNPLAGSRPFRWAAMTEGYDTDNDLIGDYDELIGYREDGVVAGTDPLDDQSPLKNRVLWLDGTNSWGRSYAWSHYGDFSKFSVEAMVRPSRIQSPHDQVIVEKASFYTLPSPIGSVQAALANFQLGIDTRGVPYILFHGRTGWTTQRASASIAGRLRANEWVHLAGVFDGSRLSLYVNGVLAAIHTTTDIPARGIEGQYPMWHPNCILAVGARELRPGWHFPVGGANFFAGAIDELRVWDRVLAPSEIMARKDRRLTPAEVGLVLPGNDPYSMGNERLFAYYTFNDLPDPAIEGISPPGIPDRPPVPMNWSQVYNDNYLVIAADRIRRIPRMPPLDTRIIMAVEDGVPVSTGGTPDPYGISTTNNYLDVTLPEDFRNSANPYNFTHWAFNIDMGRGLWMVGRAKGWKPPDTWLPVIDPDDADSFDSDGDGLPDWWEILHGLDPFDPTGEHGAWGDPDGDGLSNWAEYMAWKEHGEMLSPTKWDTSGDGRSDFDSRSSSDPYALTWGELYSAGDGIPALWKYEHGMDPLKYVAHLDPDKDGWSNYAEYMAGTDPLDPNSHPNPTISGTVSYYGNVSGPLRIMAYQEPSMDGDPVATVTANNRDRFAINGLKEGDVYLFAFIDSNNNGRWDEGEPCGIAMDQPIRLTWADVDDVRIGLADKLPGYPRFSWTFAEGTNAVRVRVNRTGTTQSPDAVDVLVQRPRNYLHEWDYQRAGKYGLEPGNYRWWAGAQSGTFHVPRYPSGSRPVPEWPRGDSMHFARNQIVWSMNTNSTMYHLQVARQESGGRLTLVADDLYPAPYRDWDGLYRDYLPGYAAEWGDGVYYWRIAGWNPSGRGPWSGDDVASVQTFSLNLSQSYSHSISGRIFYFGKVRATNIVVEVFDNYGFAGDPAARIRLTPPFTRDPDKVFPYTVRGLKPGVYYIRAFIDTKPAGGEPSGDWAFWKTQGFVRDDNSFYHPGALDLTDTTKLIDRNLVLRDRDSDGDKMPDAWEMEYFGNLAQTGDMDFDGDGISNLDEYRYSGGILNPTHWDSDGDGLSDAFELFYCGSHYGFKAATRTRRLCPVRRDTDGDGYSDGAELLRYNTDPLDPTSFPYYRPPCFGPLPSPADFDGDGRTDAALFDPLTGNWYVYTMGGLAGRLPFGDGTMIPLTGDFVADGRSDLAMYQPSSGYWHVRTVSGLSGSLQFGDANMTPVPADYSGDARTDFGVFDRVNGTWHLLTLDGRFLSVRFGLPGDVPVPGDYTGDGRTDLALYTPATGLWSVRAWTGEKYTLHLGGPTAVPVPGDYDGDGRIDFAVFDTTTGVWTVYASGGANLSGKFGWYGVIPVPGDYDGDGRMDAAFYDPSSGMWYVYTMTGNVLSGQFGWPGAFPVLGRRR